MALWSPVSGHGPLPLLPLVTPVAVKCPGFLLRWGALSPSVRTQEVRISQQTVAADQAPVKWGCLNPFWNLNIIFQPVPRLWVNHPEMEKESLGL